MKHRTLDQFVAATGTPETADERAAFAADTRAAFPRQRLTIAGWRTEVEAWRVWQRVAEKILTAAGQATPQPDGTITFALDDETALDLMTFGRRPD